MGDVLVFVVMLGEEDEVEGLMEEDIEDKIMNGAGVVAAKTVGFVSYEFCTVLLGHDIEE